MDTAATPSILCDFLESLGVRHTVGYSNRRFETMTFRTLFGLSKLLREYGIDTDTVRLTDPTAVGSLPGPFIAGAGGRYIVVTAVGPDTVSYLDGGETKSVTRRRFDTLFNGVVMIGYPSETASEPSYALHRRIDFATKAKGYVLAAAAAAVIIWFFVANRLYDNIGAILLTVTDLAGLYVSYLLVRKTLGFKDKAAEAVCGVLQAGGCDTIAESSASKFYGLFAWSEVGLAYFGVSLVTLLLFPSQWTNLALINACCLPYSFWSVWYQRRKARTWCTLCLIVQALLWAAFGCYWAGGMWTRGGCLFADWPRLIILGLVYLSAMLAINAVDTIIAKTKSES